MPTGLPLPFVVLLVALGSCTSQRQVVAEPAVELPPHPRLFLNDDQVAALSNSAVAKPFVDALLLQAEAMVAAPLVSYNFEAPRCSQPGTCLAWGPLNSTTGNLAPEPDRLPPVGSLDTATVLRRVATLAWAHRVRNTAGDSPYLRAAVRQLKATVSWPSWYWPTGQAQQLAYGMWAVAIGYDWLHADVPPSDREELREGLLRHGLLTARRAAHESPWWRRNTGSSAGLAVFSASTAACVALEGDFEGNASAVAVVAAVLEDARSRLAENLMSWGSDGVWPEGAADYGLAAQASALAAMAHPGSVSGLSSSVQQSVAEYQLLSTAPSFLAHNWGDGPTAYAHPASALMWLGNISTDQTMRQAYMYAATLQAHAGPAPALQGGLLGTGLADVMALFAVDLNADQSKGQQAYSRLKRNVVTMSPSSRQTHQGSFRQCWDCKNSSWAGFKAGDNHYHDTTGSHNNHGHLDVGNWVLEMKGQRWAVDLGDGGTFNADYFGRHRWAYYHPSSLGHNVLRFNNQTQCRTGSGAIIRTELATESPSCTLNLTDAYSCDGTGWPQEVLRSFAFVDAYQTFTINDSWSYPLQQQPVMPGKVEWAMHTTATVIVDPTDRRKATLSQGGVSVYVVADVANEDAWFEAYLPPIMKPERDWIYETSELVTPRATNLTVLSITVPVELSQLSVRITLVPAEPQPPTRSIDTTSVFEHSAARTYLPKQLAPHPRLIMDRQRVDGLRQLRETDAIAATYFDAATNRGGDHGCPDPSTVTYQGTNYNCTGPGTSIVEGCPGPGNPLYDWAWHHRMNTSAPLTQPSNCSRAAIAYVRLASAEKHTRSGNPSWFWPHDEELHLGMPAQSVGLAYDWLHPVLTTEERNLFVDYLLEMAVLPARRLYAEKRWWSFDVGNWNLVVNGGLSIAALAIADHNETVHGLASEVVSHAVSGMRHAFASYAPDGVWPEGPGYWNFGTQFALYAMASMQTALGHTYGLAESPGLEETAEYFLYMRGTSLTDAAWADCGMSDTGLGSLQDPSKLFWFSTTYNKTIYAALARWYISRLEDGPDGQKVQGEGGGLGEIDNLFYYPLGSSQQGSLSEMNTTMFPLNKVYNDPSQDRSRGRKKHLGSWRQCWHNVNCSWAGFKGGQNLLDDHGSNSHNNHGHHDLGQFVLEMKGQRWAVDIGAGFYSNANYFGRFRFSYYHTSSFGHNTLRFNNQSQCHNGSAAIVAHDPAGPTATIDLTDGYRCFGTGPSSVTRSFAFVDAYQTFTVNDSWSYPLQQQLLMPGTVEWAMHTTATVIVDQTDRRKATLSQGGVSVYAELLPRGTGDRSRSLGFSVYHPPIFEPERPAAAVTVLSVWPIDVEDGGVSVRISMIKTDDDDSKQPAAVGCVAGLLPRGHQPVPCLSVRPCGQSPVATASGFLSLESNGTAPPRAGTTNATVCYNKTHLVVTFACEDTHVNSSFPPGCYEHGTCDGCGFSGPLFAQSSTELFIARGLSGTYPPGLNWELDMGAHGSMYMNQNQSPNGTCDRARQRDDVHFPCNATGVSWRTEVVPAFGWQYYRANFHRNGPAQYQSSWSGPFGNPTWSNFHCPYVFGILALVK